MSNLFFDNCINFDTTKTNVSTHIIPKALWTQKANVQIAHTRNHKHMAMRTLSMLKIWFVMFCFVVFVVFMETKEKSWNVWYKLYFHRANYRHCFECCYSKNEVCDWEMMMPLLHYEDKLIAQILMWHISKTHKSNVNERQQVHQQHRDPQRDIKSNSEVRYTQILIYVLRQINQNLLSVIY